jgi:acetylornithine aminotransferase
VLPPDGYLAAARRVTADRGALLWLDEVQTGIGRTGEWFAHSRTGVVPDVVTLAKGLGGGIPVGACIGVGPAGELLQPGNHGTTFGGNPVAAAASLAVLDTIESDGMLSHVRETGMRLRAGLAHDHVTEVRGEGLLVGLDLDADKASAVARAALARGFIVNDCTPSRIRFAPPLVLSTAQVDDLVAAWPMILADAYAEETP